MNTAAASEAENLVNLDIGGTFTDAYLVVDGQHVTGKSLTTHADLADGLLGAVSDAAAKVGRSLDEVLGAAEVVRYSTTVGTNALDRAGRSAGRPHRHGRAGGHDPRRPLPVVGRRDAARGAARPDPRAAPT